MNQLSILLPNKQRGAAAITAAIMFVLIVGAAALYALDMGNAQVTDASLSSRDLETRMLAEAGLERAFYRFKKGTACTALGGDGPHAFNGGTFTVTTGVLEGANCRATVVAQVGVAKKTVSGVTSPGGPTTYSFLEPFISSADFTAKWSVQVLSKNEGSILFNSANCNVAACAGATGGSMMIETDPAGSGDALVGYRERSISPIDTAVFTSISYSIAEKKYYQGNKAGSQSIELILVDSSTGRSQSLWSDNTTNNDNIWRVYSGTASLTNNRVYDRLRITFTAREFKFNQVWMWADQISLTAP